MSAESQLDELVWNPLDPGLADDPCPRYKRLRDLDPVYFEKSLGWWFVTGHEEARQVLREPGGSMNFAEFQQMRMGRDVRDEPYCRHLRNFVPMVDSLDDHKRIRATVRRNFTPKRVQALRSQIAATANELLDQIEPIGAADLMPAFALPLPLATISRLLDVPKKDEERILEYVERFKLAVQLLPMNDEQLAKANGSIGGLNAYFTGLVEQRRRSPGDDLLSMLIQEADEGVLSEDELISNAWGLYAAGFDTTTGSIGAAMVALLENADQLELLRGDPSLVPGAVEELIRYAGMSQATHRVFPHEVRIREHTIAPHTPVVVYLMGANRDERWIEQPDALDITRAEPKDDLTFGDGVHKCLGKHLAKMTLEIAVGSLVTRLDGLRLDGEVEWDRENLPVFYPSTVPIAWHPSREST